MLDFGLVMDVRLLRRVQKCWIKNLLLDRRVCLQRYANLRCEVSLPVL